MNQLTFLADEYGSACFSPCRNYRYSLGRPVPGDGRGRVLFVMLNPSTADESQDDPTIRRCRAFARSWGYAEMRVANLFAWRATDPRELPNVAEPVGPDNDLRLGKEMLEASRVVFAWGNHGKLLDRIRQVEDLAHELGVAAHCLGTTKAGHPRYPLYVRGDQPLIPYLTPEDDRA